MLLFQIAEFITEGATDSTNNLKKKTLFIQHLEVVKSRIC